MGKVRKTLLATGLAAVVGLTGCSFQVRDGYSQYQPRYYGGMLQHTHGYCRHTHLINTPYHQHRNLYCPNPWTQRWEFFGDSLWFNSWRVNPPHNRYDYRDNRNHRNPSHDRRRDSGRDRGYNGRRDGNDRDGRHGGYNQPSNRTPYDLGIPRSGNDNFNYGDKKNRSKNTHKKSSKKSRIYEPVKKKHKVRKKKH